MRSKWNAVPRSKRSVAMRNKKNVVMSSAAKQEFVGLFKDGDWDTIIAKVEGDETSLAYSVFAKLFKQSGKLGKKDYEAIIEALSNMLVKDGCIDSNARILRAYTYYLSGNYERAISDCKKLTNNLFAEELLGLIYHNKGEYEKVKEHYKNVLFNNLENIENLQVSPLLLDAYIKANKQ